MVEVEIFGSPLSGFLCCSGGGGGWNGCFG